jgi:hypothetical protein
LACFAHWIHRSKLLALHQVLFRRGYKVAFFLSC